MPCCPPTVKVTGTGGWWQFPAHFPVAGLCDCVCDCVCVRHSCWQEVEIATSQLACVCEINSSTHRCVVGPTTQSATFQMNMFFVLVILNRITSTRIKQQAVQRSIKVAGSSSSSSNTGNTGTTGSSSNSMKLLHDFALAAAAASDPDGVDMVSTSEMVYQPNRTTIKFPQRILCS